MLYVILIGSVLFSVGAIYFLYSIVRKDSKNNVLSNLGLQSGISSTVKSPFYKWAWRKKSGERVWGERIVREAFDTAGLALSADDLEFFKQACEQFAKGKSVQKDAILERVDAITKRSASVSNIATDYIRPNLDEALNHTPAQAKAILAKLKIQATNETALGRLATLKCSQVLFKIGAAILHPGDEGFDIKDKSGHPLLTLKGLEGWEQWLKAVQQAAKHYIDNSPMVKKTGTSRLLKTQILTNTIDRYQEDFKNLHTFVKQLHRSFEQNDIPISVESVENFQKSLYYWTFYDTRRFSIKQIQQIREFFLRTDLNPHFLELILLNLNSDYDSLAGLLKKFPVHVIVYGHKDDAREFIAQQYPLHVFHLQNLITELTGVKPLAPMLIRVIQSELEKARNGELALVTNQTLNQEDEEDEDSIQDRGHLPLLLNLYKQRVLFEKNLDPKVMADVGWIIEIPVEDFTPKEHAQLDITNYMFYKRVNCDKTGNPYFDQDSNVSLMQRQKYFGEVLKALTAE